MGEQPLSVAVREVQRIVVEVEVADLLVVNGLVCLVVAGAVAALA